MIARLISAAFFVLCVALTTGPADALELDLPTGAQLTAQRDTGLDNFDAPVAAFDGSGVQTLSVEGAIARQAWRISLPGLTPLQVMVPLRHQLSELGYRVIFECEASTCGGFDFRFNTEVLPGPNMYVNISRYRYLTAAKDDRSDVVGILASVTAGSAYVQIIHARERGEGPVPPPLRPSEGTDNETEPTLIPDAPDDLLAALKQNGRMVLADLDFDVGTTDLGQGPFESLIQLAALLRDRGDLRIALVGHTDTVGALSVNFALSRDRARSVRNRLVTEHGVDGARLDAEGVAYLAPVAPNLTDAGRALNRRVEAVLINLD